MSGSRSPSDAKRDEAESSSSSEHEVPHVRQVVEKADQLVCLRTGNTGSIRDVRDAQPACHRRPALALLRVSVIISLSSPPG